MAIDTNLINKFTITVYTGNVHNRFFGQRMPLSINVKYDFTNCTVFAVNINTA